MYLFQVTDANHKATMCSCNHLTSFGSGFFVMPNAIDFGYVFANAGMQDCDEVNSVQTCCAGY